MEPNTYYIHDLDPVMIHLWGDFGIRYYGLSYILGFVVAFWLLRRYYKTGKITLTPDQQSTAMFALVLGVLIGGRLGHVLLYDISDTLRHPLSIFMVWKGGMASHGGFVGVAVATWWISRHFKISYLSLGDILASIAPAGLCFGRIANFINGELWGKVSDVPWAVIFPRSAPHAMPVEMIPPRHPSQLYEALLEGALIFIYVQWRLWKTRVLTTPGRLLGEFIFLYAIMRIIGEIFKEPEATLLFGLQRGIFYSIFFAVMGLILVIQSYRRSSASS